MSLLCLSIAIYAAVKYITIKIASDSTSVSTSLSDAPIVCRRTKPCMPNVDGNIFETACTHEGIASAGNEMPLIISSGIDVHKRSNNGVSRRQNSVESAMAAKIQASRYMLMKMAISPARPLMG